MAAAALIVSAYAIKKRIKVPRKSQMHTTATEVETIMSLPTCSVENAAKVLGIGRSQAYQAVNAGEIRSIHIGKRILVPTLAIKQLLDGSDTTAA